MGDLFILSFSWLAPTQNIHLDCLIVSQKKKNTTVSKTMEERERKERKKEEKFEAGKKKRHGEGKNVDYII